MPNDADLLQMRLRECRDARDALNEIVKAIRGEASSAQQAIYKLGVEFCGEEFDRLYKEHRDFSSWPSERLLEIILPRLRTMQMVAHNAGVYPERLAAARQEAEQYKADAERLRQRVHELERELETRIRQIAVLEKTREAESQADKAAERKHDGVDAATVVPSSARGTVAGSDSATWDTWFASWQTSRARGNDEAILRAIGNSGMYRVKRVAQETGLPSTTLYRRLDTLESAGVLALTNGTPVAGRPSREVFLTEKGKWVYTRLTGQSPVAPRKERLLAEHKSARHLAVIVEAADAFTRLGCEVDTEPQRIPVEGGVFMPDLLVRKNGETWYVEVEQGKHNEAALQRKWRNAHIAGGGHLWVVTDKPGRLNTIQGSVLQWATLNGKDVTFHGTHLRALKDATPGKIWLRNKRFQW